MSRNQLIITPDEDAFKHAGDGVLDINVTKILEDIPDGLFGYVTLRFNHEITNTEVAFCILGGYEVTSGEKTTRFDFSTAITHIDEGNGSIIHVKLSYLDYKTFPAIKDWTVEDFLNISAFEDFCVDMEGDNTLIPVALEHFSFQVFSADGHDVRIYLSEDVCDTAFKQEESKDDK